MDTENSWIIVIIFKEDIGMPPMAYGPGTYAACKIYLEWTQKYNTVKQAVLCKLSTSEEEMYQAVTGQKVC